MRNFYSILIFALATLFSTSIYSQTIVGKDDASNYDDTNFPWENESNLGFGFSDWNLWNENAGGWFLGDSDGQGFGNINTADKAFGLWGNPIGGNYAHASRNLSEWKDGYTFEIDLAIAWRNGNKGIDLLNEEDEVIYTFFASGDEYQVHANGTTVIFDEVVWDYLQKSIFHLNVAQYGDNLYVTLSRGALEHNVVIEDTSLKGFHLFVGNTVDGNDLNNLYFNNLVVRSYDYILFDDFNRANSNTVGIPSSQSTEPSWFEGETDSPASVKIEGNMLKMGSSTKGKDFISYDMAGLYPVAFDEATDTLRWAWNWQQNRGNLYGFNGSNYGAAFVVGCNKEDFTDGGAYGYAVVHGGPTNPNNDFKKLRLVKFKNGLEANIDIQTIIEIDLGNDYKKHSSFKLEYNSCDNKWTLYFRDDGSTSFVSPVVGSYDGIETGYDATYTATELPFSGFLWSHSNPGSPPYYYVDNFYIPASTVPAENEYVWSGGSSGSYITAENWFPERTCPRKRDRLVFNSGNNDTITNVISETIGQLIVTNNTEALFRNAISEEQNILILTGGDSLDFVIDSGSVLNLNSKNASYTTEGIIIVMNEGVTGEISGTLVYDNSHNSDGREHQVFVADSAGLRIKNGGIIHAKHLNLSGTPPFGAGTHVLDSAWKKIENVVIFEAGSKYIQASGSTPFGLGQPKSKVMFEPGSWLEFISKGIPAMSGRTYANLKYEPYEATSIKSLEGKNDYSIDTLIINNGGLIFEINDNKVGTIRGDITVGSGALLEFSPTTANGGTKESKVKINGDVAQTISGNGTLKFGDGARLEFHNPHGVYIQKDIETNGVGPARVEGNAVVHFEGENKIFGSGSATIVKNSTVYIGSKDGITKTPSNTGNIQTTNNRTYNNQAAYVYNGTVNQVTGDGLPTSLENNGRLEIDNPGNTVSLTNGTVMTPKLTLAAGKFEVGENKFLRIRGKGTLEATVDGNFAPDEGAGTVEFLGMGTVVADGDLDFYKVKLLQEQDSSGVDFGAAGNPTVSDTLTINTTKQWVNTNPPTYLDGSTLFYSITGNYIAGAEWAANETTGKGVPYNVAIGKNNKGTHLTFDDTTDSRYLKNDLTIGGTSGSAISSFTLSTAYGGDLKLDGDLVLNQKGEFYPNQRAVFFEGNDDQVITSHNTDDDNTATFHYFIVDKSSGVLKLDDSPGTTVEVVESAPGGWALELLSGNINLNGQTFVLGGEGNLRVQDMNREIFSSTPANFNIVGKKEVIAQNSGALEFSDKVIVNISDGVDFGENGITTVNATLQINPSGYADIHAPRYGENGILMYNTGSNYLRRVEWNGNPTLSDYIGLPNQVIVKDGTTLIASGDNDDEMDDVPFHARSHVEIEEGAKIIMQNMIVPLSVGGDLIIDGELTASDLIGGDIYVAGDWTRSASGIFNPNDRQVLFNGTSPQTITAAGGEEFDWLGFDSVGTKTLADNIIVNKKLEIFGSSGAFQPLANTITLKGHWENQVATGGFDAGTSTVIFEGDDTQNVKAVSGKENFYDVKINSTADKSTGVILDDTDLGILEELILTKGLIHTGSAQVHYKEGALSSNGNDDSYINGYARKTRFTEDVEFVFPVGYYNSSKDVYQPAAIIPTTTSATANFTVDYVHENYFPGTWVPNHPPAMEAGLETVSDCDYWNIERGPEDLIAAKVRLYWSDACFDIYEPNDLVVAKVLNEEWINMGQSVVSTTPPYTSGYVESQVISSFSPFAIGSTNAINVLPVELISFHAQPVGRKVETTWKTETEKNNAYFTVEKSLDSKAFIEVGRIEGAGNSTTPISYSFTDENPYNGVSYYRLKQTDFDGRYTYSEVRSVKLNSDTRFQLVKAYRTYYDDVAIAYQSESEQLQVEVMDMLGKVIYREQIQNEGGFSRISPNLARGIYLLRLSNDTEAQTQKFFY